MYRKIRCTENLKKLCEIFQKVNRPQAITADMHCIACVGQAQTRQLVTADERSPLDCAAHRGQQPPPPAAHVLSVPMTVGGINPYTLTTRLGSGGLAHHDTVRGLIQLLGVSPKETRRGDQARFWSVRIGIDIVLTVAIVTDQDQFSDL